MQDIVIHHNPACSKSRETLQLLRDQGVEPRIVRYLDDPLNEARLRALLELLQLKPSELARRSESTWKELALDDADEAEVLQAMVDHPILIQRPIVVAGDRAVLGRPPDNVLQLIRENP